MTDSRRLTTDRFFGGTGKRIELLIQFLTFVGEHQPTLDRSKGWILSNTNAQSRDAIERHLKFLETFDLISIDHSSVSLDSIGNEYLKSASPMVLYDALRSNVKGFDSILGRMQDNEMTDEGIRNLLVSEIDDFNMNSTGVATRHREWLQVLGLVERSGGVNRLTEKGDGLATRIHGDFGGALTDEERTSKLRSLLLQSEMACISVGRKDLTEDIYPTVKATYPGLCVNSYRCDEAHESGKDQPEWKHAVRDIQQRLADREGSRVYRLDEHGSWQYGDTEVDSGDQSGVVDLPEGTDSPKRRKSTSRQIVRNQKLVDQLKNLYDHTCQICGDRRLKGPVQGFSHIHHLKPLGGSHGGPDVPRNTIIVCPNHHEDFENGMISINPETLVVKHQYEDEVDGKPITTTGDHEIGCQFIQYHNQVRAQNCP